MRLSLGEPSFQGTRTNLQNNQRKMDWRCGSNSRVPALQMQSPEIKHQSLQKKKIIIIQINVGTNYQE
jgi:hypothetical protein